MYYLDQVFLFIFNNYSRLIRRLYVSAKRLNNKIDLLIIYKLKTDYGITNWVVLKIQMQWFLNSLWIKNRSQDL